jgi:hypothetical protein
MTLLSLTAKKFAIKTAARRLRQEAEKAGVDTLIKLAEAGVSIVGTYLNGCSPQEKTLHRSELNTILKMGITADEVLDEVARQMPKVSSIIQRQEYRQRELKQIDEFLKGG